MRDSIVNRFDCLIGLLFLGLATALWLGRWGGLVPFPLLGGDAANVASFAAARVYPDRFAADALLFDFGNFAFYNILHVWLLEMLFRLGIEPGTGYLFFHVPALVIQSLGFYWLGTRWLGSRWWGLALSLANVWTVPAFEGDYWGPWRDPQPRMLFQSALPWVLIGLDNGKVRWRRSVGLFAAAGLLTYVHPPSGPVLAGMIGCALLLQKPAGLLGVRHFLRVGAAGLAYVVAVAPFGWTYLQTVISASQGVAPSVALEATALRFQASYLNIPVGFVSALSETWLGYRFWLPLIVVLLFAMRRRSALGDSRARILTGMFLGLIIVSVCIPLLDYGVASLRGRFPTQFDLCRGIRFHIPLLILTGALLLQGSLAKHKSWHPIAALLFLVAWSVSAVTDNPFRQPLAHALRFLECGLDPSCLYGNSMVYGSHAAELTALLRHLRGPAYPEGTSFFAPEYSVAIRYGALRPLVFDFKDGAILPYVNHRLLMRWAQQAREFKELPTIEGVDRILAQLAFCKRWHGNFLVSSSDPGVFASRPELAYAVSFANRAGFVISCGV